MELEVARADDELDLAELEERPADDDRADERALEVPRLEELDDPPVVDEVFVVAVVVLVAMDDPPVVPVVTPAVELVIPVAIPPLVEEVWTIPVDVEPDEVPLVDDLVGMVKLGPVVEPTRACAVVALEDELGPLVEPAECVEPHPAVTPANNTPIASSTLMPLPV